VQKAESLKHIKKTKTKISLPIFLNLSLLFSPLQLQRLYVYQRYLHTQPGLFFVSLKFSVMKKQHNIQGRKERNKQKKITFIDAVDHVTWDFIFYIVISNSRMLICVRIRTSCGWCKLSITNKTVVINRINHLWILHAKSPQEFNVDIENKSDQTR
jgi:hypothetical protein